MMILVGAWSQFIPHLNVVDMINARSQGRLWFIAKYLNGASITRDKVSKFIDTAATKTITMKLCKTQVGHDLLNTSGLVVRYVVSPGHYRRLEGGLCQTFS